MSAPIPLLPTSRPSYLDPLRMPTSLATTNSMYSGPPVDYLVVLLNENSSVDIIGAILSREADEREDMDIEERTRADDIITISAKVDFDSDIFGDTTSSEDKKKTPPTNTSMLSLPSYPTTTRSDIADQPNPLIGDTTIKPMETVLFEICTNKHSSRVMQTLLGDCTEQQKVRLLTPLMSSAVFLASDAFGNYVVQRMLDCEERRMMDAVCTHLTGHLHILSRSKFGSNVAERVVEVVSNEGFVFVVLDMFGLFDESLGFRSFRMNTYASTTPSPPLSLTQPPLLPSHQNSLSRFDSMTVTPAVAGPTSTSGQAVSFTPLFHPPSRAWDGQKLMEKDSREHLLGMVNKPQLAGLISDRFANCVFQRMIERAEGDVFEFVLGGIEKVWSELESTLHGRHVKTTIEKVHKDKTGRERKMEKRKGDEKERGRREGGRAGGVLLLSLPSESARIPRSPRRHGWYEWKPGMETTKNDEDTINETKESILPTIQSSQAPNQPLSHREVPLSVYPQPCRDILIKTRAQLNTSPNWEAPPLQLATLVGVVQLRRDEQHRSWSSQITTNDEPNSIRTPLLSPAVTFGSQLTGPSMAAASHVGQRRSGRERGRGRDKRMTDEFSWKPQTEWTGHGERKEDRRAQPQHQKEEATPTTDVHRADDRMQLATGEKGSNAAQLSVTLETDWMGEEPTAAAPTSAKPSAQTQPDEREWTQLSSLVFGGEELKPNN
ncbi:hypothetical protein BLNAU_10726 [Blattamonas nauphoetae]|uniref:Uncharacterized protein n=1 Tax=Blattamonas nauphoetae TaxID=2049346 RepID=A0ABQ9XRC1_9EUKA|nr:hypothetical protein BLNAU_10726 [Blattamonas nauphoetae]